MGLGFLLMIVVWHMGPLRHPGTGWNKDRASVHPKSLISWSQGDLVSRCLASVIWNRHMMTSLSNSLDITMVLGDSKHIINSFSFTRRTNIKVCVGEGRVLVLQGSRLTESKNESHRQRTVSKVTQVY